jgi:SAM-dependent methyltransferase
MTLWPRPAGEMPDLDLDAITREVERFAHGCLPPWEAGYIDYHRRRYQDTLRLLPPGEGRRLLDVGSFPGHLSALAQGRGWDVTGLNNDIEGAGVWTAFLERCQERKIEILACEVERERFPTPTASFDAVLFCELFEHLHVNPFHTLKEIFRVLKPGGLLLLTTPNLRRAETLFRYVHGWGVQPPVSRTFHELFPSLLYHRHNREYTANELTYYLALQGKDLYDFRLDAVHYSDSLDGNHEIPGPLAQRPGRLEHGLASALRWLIPSTRNQLIARAWRSEATLVEWAELGSVSGFGPLEEDFQPIQGFTRRLTFPFRVTGPRASFDLPLPAGTGPVLVSLMVAHPVSGDTPPAQTHWTLDGQPAMTLEVRPSPRPVRVRLLVPVPLAAQGTVRLTIESSLWHDASLGRDFGLHVGGQWVLTERLVTRAAVDAAIERARLERQAEDSVEGWWHPAASLWLLGRALPSRLDMEAEDEGQLGPGWYHREHWGRLGAMRWTAGEALAYLGTDGRASNLRMRAYSGEPNLGAVQGRLLVHHAELVGDYELAGERAFTIPPDTWEEFTVPIPTRSGRLRITISVDPLRVPRELVPGSLDDRGLGLAVKRLWLV